MSPKFCKEEDEDAKSEDAKSEDVKSDCGDSSSPKLSCGSSQKKKKREKSLGQLCMQFINLFVQKSQELSLEQAASMLSTGTLTEFHKIKTKVLSYNANSLDPKTLRHR